MLLASLYTAYNLPYGEVSLQEKAQSSLWDFFVLIS